MTHIVLTTFPAHKSRNVGDALITQSAVKLVQRRFPNFSPVILFREKPLDGFTKRVKHQVLAPGFSVSEGTYPNLYSLFTDLDRMDHFWPVGCSFQASLAREDEFKTPLSAETLLFLQRIAQRWGPFPCRDQLIVKRLQTFDLPAYYFGDLALFDEEMIGSEPRLPKQIKSLVITLGHHTRYLEQVIDLAKKIARTYPNVRKYVSMHSVPNTMYQVLERRMKELGFESLHVYGDASNLLKYEEIDLHIGYRLHGHIYFLRRRKPSILMVEDARSYGFARTSGTQFGTVEAWSRTNNEPDDEAPARALALLQDQQNRGFMNYEPVFQFIDNQHTQYVAPYFDKVAAELAR